MNSFDWWARQGSNLGPTDYESSALTAELRARRDCCAVELWRSLHTRTYTRGSAARQVA